MINNLIVTYILHACADDRVNKYDKTHCTLSLCSAKYPKFLQFSKIMIRF